MPGIIPEDKLIPSVSYIKSADFAGDGLVLKVAGFKIYTPEDPKFAVEEDSFLVKEGIIEAGQAFQFTFTDEEGSEHVYNTKSSRFYNSFQKLNPAVGDSIHITRTGDGTNTQYSIVRA